MSDSARSPEFSELWKNHVCKVHRNQNQDRDTKMPGTTTSVCNGWLSPRVRSSSRYSWNHADSPDVEVSQDIFWDSTSPTQTGWRNKNNREVEISDIVNRIFPQNMKPKGTDSSLFHWIDDGTITCTPEIPKSRVRKRQSRVDDLLNLARQFDKNMQQDQEISEQLNAVDNNLHVTVNSSETNLKPTCPSLLDRAEVELHALFDCSTQGVSGRFSEGSVSSGSAEQQQAELQPADESGSSARPAQQKETCTNNCVDFDDDWENDDLLNDSFILAITQNPNDHLNDHRKTLLVSHTLSKPNSNSAAQFVPKLSCSSLQKLCSKPKTTNRSTFKLQPNSHLQPKKTRDVSESIVTVIQPEPEKADANAATPTTLPTSKHSRVTDDQSGVSSVNDISDSLWDDGDDDALLYRICDDVERISNSQPKEASSNNCREKQEIPETNSKWSLHSGVSTNTRSSGSFPRSNSLPGTSCEANHQGWNVNMKGANNKPERPVGLGVFKQARDFSGTVRAEKGDVEMKPQNSKSHHAAFKRNASDSAITSSKVFITSQSRATCSAAEIEKKKQEALARRRLRMQNAVKP